MMPYAASLLSRELKLPTAAEILREYGPFAGADHVHTSGQGKHAGRRRSVDNEVLKSVMGAFAVGIGATAVMDVCAILQKRLFGVQSLDYRLVGRWLGHFRHGKFAHDSIGKAPAVRGEAVLGWTAHYAIGILFAGILVWIWGIDWLRQPTLAPALIVGIGSIVAPFFIMQPGLGAGVAASRTPKPWLSRFRSLVTHTCFAAGLYLSALLVSQLHRMMPA
jgi:hypothetical protein